MTVPVPAAVQLNNGVELPAVGLGVWQTEAQETMAAVATALRSGYRLIDTAASYFNERGVGEGIRRSGVDRSEVFIETKVWISDYGFDQTRRAFDKAAGKLGVSQIDLLLLHQPLPLEFDLYIQAYQALEGLLRDGRVRAIGVSNLMPEYLTRLLAETDVVPSVNQVEVHPYFRQPDVLAANAAHGIASHAWSPLGGVTFYRSGRSSTLADPVIASIARDHGRSPAQIMLRWHLQRGRCVVPKSANPARIMENLDVFGFDLTPAELARIDGLHTGIRGGRDPYTITFDTYAAISEIPET